MKRVMLAAVAATTIGLAGAAAAQTTIQKPDGVRFEKVTTLDFNLDDIEGQLVSPRGTMTTSRGRATFKNLVQVRGDFMGELHRSTDNL